MGIHVDPDKTGGLSVGEEPLSMGFPDPPLFLVQLDIGEMTFFF